MHYVLVRLKQAEAGNEHLAVEVNHLHGLNDIVLANDMLYLWSIETKIVQTSDSGKLRLDPRTQIPNSAHQCQNPPRTTWLSISVP